MSKFMPKKHIFKFYIPGDRLSPESILLDYDYNPPKSSRAQINMKFNKKDFPVKKRDLCKFFGCGTFDIHNFCEQEELDNVSHPYLIDSENINLYLLNILKIIQLDVDKIDMDSISKFLSSFQNLNYPVEIKSRISYLNLLESNKKSIKNVKDK